MSNKPNSNAARRRYKLSEFVERRNVEAGIEVETDDGSVFLVPAPECWPDEFRAVALSGDAEAQARCVMGDAEFDRFVAAGGSGRLLNAIFADAQGVDTGN